jgi:RHS repeat-associated protein
MLTDNGGAVVNVLVYDAYGNLIASNGVLQTAYLYSGQQFDPDLGLYLNRARYLNTGTGRFWTMDSTEGDQEDPLSLHKYLYAADDPVDNEDPSGNDYGDFDITIGSIFGFLSLIGPAVTSEPVFSSIAYSPSIIVYISVDAGAPMGFDPKAIQTKLQTELSANVFDHPPAGRSVTIKVHEESSGPGILGWVGSPKHTYVDRVDWKLKADDIASSNAGRTSINELKLVKSFSGPTTQTYVNIFAHEVIWLNAGGHWDHFSPVGEIGCRTPYAYNPYTVLPGHRTDLRSDFGF